MSKDEKKLWINGQFVEVTDEVYQAYMQGDRKMRYFEADLKVERTVLDDNGHIQKVIPSKEDSLDRLIEDNAKQFADHRESVEDAVFRKVAEDELHQALSKLTEDEYALIYALFFEGRTIRSYAQELGVYPNAVHKQKKRILKKLKEFLK